MKKNSGELIHEAIVDFKLRLIQKISVSKYHTCDKQEEATWTLAQENCFGCQIAEIIIRERPTKKGRN